MRQVEPAIAKSPPAAGAANGSRLDATEIRRRVWHMTPGLLPLALWFYPHADPISPTLRAILLGVVVVLGLFVYGQYRRIERQGEQGQRLMSVAGYAGSVLVTLLLFPAHIELGLTVLAVLAFGDGSATLLGKLLGGPGLPWNPEKSWSGFLGFIAIGGSMASLIYWGETHFNPEALGPGVSLAQALACGFAPAILGAVYESIPSKLNDNLRVGATAAATVTAVHILVVGWP